MVNLSSIGHVVTIKGEIGNLSNEMQIEISSEPIEVLEIIDLIFPSSFVEEVNGSMKADASVILTDETDVGVHTSSFTMAACRYL